LKGFLINFREMKTFLTLRLFRYLEILKVRQCVKYLGTNIDI